MSQSPPPMRGLVYALGEHRPQIDASAFVAPTALVAGQVALAEDASVWPQSVLRADVGRIAVGARSNVQDGSVIHCTAGRPTLIGEDVVIGHGARLEGCVVEDAALVGMQAVLLHDVTVGAGAIVAAGAVVAPRTRIPPGALAKGVPARLTEAETAEVAEQRAATHRGIARGYVENARRWMAELRAAG